MDFPSSFENAIDQYIGQLYTDLYQRYWMQPCPKTSARIITGTEVFTFHHGALAYELRDMFEAGGTGTEDGTQVFASKPSATSIFIRRQGTCWLYLGRCRNPHCG